MLGIEPLTARKSAGVCIAVFGVVAALASGLAAAPPGAWRGEAIMTGAVLCMAFYNVWSRPFMARSSPLGFLTVGMGPDGQPRGSIARRNGFGLGSGSLTALNEFGPAHWIAGIYLGVAGGALAFDPLGSCAAASLAHAGRKHHDGQSHRCRAPCRPPRR